MSPYRVKVPTIPYFAYAALVVVKKILGLGGNRNRKFLVWKLIRLINRGKVSTDNISVTSVGKNDGVGAQAMAKFSAMCFAEAFGIKYVHAPFASLAHAEDSPEQWAASWEKLLNMNIGNMLLDEKNMTVVRLEKYLEDPTLWKKEVVVADLHFHPICGLAPSLGSEVAKKLRNAIHVQRSPQQNACDFVIGVHVRLGDVRKGDADTGHRFVANGHIISIVEKVSEVACHLGQKPQIHLHTNGTPEQVRDFSRLPNLTYHAGESALETFASLVRSDVLISARSDFSMLAGIYCKGVVVCDSRHRTPLEEWIKVSPGAIDIKCELESKLGPITINPNSEIK